MRRCTLPSLLTCTLLLAACGPAADETPVIPEPPAEERAVVYAGSYPLAYFAGRLGGGAFEVIFPVPADADPEEWIPDDETAAAMQNADLILLSGAGFESWPEIILLPEDRTVDTSAAFRDRLLEVEDAVTHQHGPHGVHTHGGTASIVWLDPRLAAQQAQAVEEALAKVRPDLTADIAQRGGELRADLTEIDNAWERLLTPLQDGVVRASHPVYQYFAKRYGLDVKSVHWEPTEHPDADEWEKFDRQLQQNPSAWMLWEGDPLPETAAELARRGIKIVVVDPNLQPPDTGDFLTTAVADLTAASSLLGPPPSDAHNGDGAAPAP